MPHVPPCPAAPVSRQDPVVDVLHGVGIEDPFRWLEDGTSQGTMDWIAAQNAYTDQVLRGREEVAAMHRTLSRVLLSGVEYGSARAAKGMVFFLRHAAGESQAKLCVREGDGPERVLVDPCGADGLTALDWYHVSPDGALVAFGLSRRGTEDSVLHVAEVASGRVLADRIPHARYASVAWLADHSGFYYTRHPKPGEVPKGEEFYHNHIFLHRLGSDPGNDPKVFGDGRPMEERNSLRLSDDGSVLYVMAQDGWRKTAVFRMPTGTGGRAAALLEGYDATFGLDLCQGRTLFLTNQGAPHYRIVDVDPEEPGEPYWREIVPESQSLVLRDFVVSSGRMLVSALEDVSAHVFLQDVATGRRTEVALPGPGTVAEVCAGPDDDFLLVFHSFVQAPTVYRVDSLSGTLSPIAKSTTPEGARQLAVRQVFYTSADGTRIPMYIVARRDLGPGPHPTVLTGYGGFNDVRASAWSPRTLPWLFEGGVYALANLRGGGEYGEDWHRAGMLGKKQNVFDDFFAAAEYLVAQGITDREHLGAFGRSNGGLLMGACLTQRPDLFRAIVCGVPLLDMLRYDRFLIGALWTTEYGTAANAQDFRWLHAYSPYHHVRKGVAYPPAYLYAAMDDGRVDALHARKMTALLQESMRAAPGGCILMRTEFDAGHGVGKPIAAVVEEQEEVWGFLAWQLGLGAGPR